MKSEHNSEATFSFLLEIAIDEIERTRMELPDQLRTALNEIALVLEEFPSPTQEAGGIAGDQLGLFDGSDATEPSSPRMPRIVLWLRNHWEMCEAVESDFREEVRITFLHELGHYLGLDEEDISERGLE